MDRNELPYPILAQLAQLLKFQAHLTLSVLFMAVSFLSLQSKLPVKTQFVHTLAYKQLNLSHLDQDRVL